MPADGVCSFCEEKYNAGTGAATGFRLETGKIEGMGHRTHRARQRLCQIRYTYRTYFIAVRHVPYGAGLSERKRRYIYFGSGDLWSAKGAPDL